MLMKEFLLNDVPDYIKISKYLTDREYPFTAEEVKDLIDDISLFNTKTIKDYDKYVNSINETIWQVTENKWWLCGDTSLDDLDKRMKFLQCVELLWAIMNYKNRQKLSV